MVHSDVLTNIIIKKFNRIQKKAQATKSRKHVIYYIKDAIEILDTNPELAFIGDVIISRANADKMDMMDAYVDALDRIDCWQEDLKLYVKKENIDLHDLIKEFDDYDSGKAFSTWDILQVKVDIFIRELMILARLGAKHDFFISSYANISRSDKEDPRAIAFQALATSGLQDCSILACRVRIVCSVEWFNNDKDDIRILISLSPYFKWLEEKEEIENNKKYKLWYFWELFVWIYNFYKRGKEIKSKMLEEKNLIDLGRFFSFKENLEHFISGKTNNLLGLTLDDLKYGLEKLCFFAVEKLMLDSLGKEPDKKDDVYPEVAYDSGEAKLAIDEFIIKISKRRYIHKILPIICKFITENKDYIWVWDQVFEQDQGKTPSRRNEKYQRKLYDAYGYLNKEACKQTGGKLKQIIKAGRKKSRLCLIRS